MQIHDHGSQFILLCLRIEELHPDPLHLGLDIDRAFMPEYALNF